MLQKENSMLNYLLKYILIVKLLWLLFTFSHIILTFYGKSISLKYKKIVDDIDDILRVIFLLLIGVLLVYLYNHLTPAKVCIHGHTKLYLYTFGILTILGCLQKLFRKYYIDVKI